MGLAASPTTPLLLAAILVSLAALVNRFAPKKKRRIRRATILCGLYATCSLLGLALQAVRADAWGQRVRLLADLFEVLVVVDLSAIVLFDLLLLALRIEIADIAHDLVLGAGYLLAGIGLMHRSGVNLSGIVATSAVVTAVLGLSLQTTLSNVIGGIALQLDHTITVGHWVQLQNGLQGRIRAIRWRSTLLETRNWDTVVVPNAALLGEQITILGEREDQPPLHRMWVHFAVDFRHSPEEVIRAVDEALRGTPIQGVAPEPAAHAICTELGDPKNPQGVATYAVRYWLTDLAKDDPTSSAVRVRIFAALKRAQIPLAVPAQAVFVSQDDQEHEDRKAARELSRRAASLAAIPLFASLSGEERAVLARCMRAAPFGRGEVITRQGATAHWLYVITRGEVEVRVYPEGGPVDGPEGKLVRRLSAPEVFGEMGVMTGEPRAASVIAETEVECYRLDRQAFRELLEGRPDLVEAISKVMAARRAELESVRENLSAEQRNRRVLQEEVRILSKVQRFFGLNEES
jgi:CRP-like cAMP-binding protein/small-conductance mechanosensitive channel